MTAGITNPLLAEALEAHGSIERWRNLRGLSCTIVTGGRLWGLKGTTCRRRPARRPPTFTGNGPWLPRSAILAGP